MVKFGGMVAVRVGVGVKVLDLMFVACTIFFCTYRLNTFNEEIESGMVPNKPFWVRKLYRNCWALDSKRQPSPDFARPKVCMNLRRKWVNARMCV